MSTPTENRFAISIIILFIFVIIEFLIIAATNVSGSYNFAARQKIKICENSLPRNQYCYIEMKAIPGKKNE